jgi:hypothetical protein
MRDDLTMQSRVIQHRDSSTNLGMALSRVATPASTSQAMELDTITMTEDGPDRSSSSLPMRPTATKRASDRPSAAESGSFRSGDEGSVMMLLDELREQLNCDAIILTSKTHPVRTATNGDFRVLDTDFELEGNTPSAMCFSTKETVSVKNALVDRRFDVNALNPLSVSYLCVPFLDMGVIIALNKNHQISKAAVPFPAMDEPIIKLYASVLKDMDGDDVVDSRWAQP